MSYHKLCNCFVKKIMDKNHNTERENTIKNLPSEYCISQSFIPCRYVLGVTEIHLKGALIILYTKMVERKLAVLEYHLQEVSIAQEEGDREWEKRAYGHLGDAYYDLGDFQQAIEHCTQSLSIAKELGERTWEGKVYGSLGNAYLGLGNFKQAVECHKQDLSITKDLGDREGEGTAYHNLGIAYYRLGDFKQATECHSQQLSIAKEVGDRDEEGHAYRNLGNAYYGLGSFKEATEYHKQALRITKDLGDRAGEGGAYANLGSANYGLGDFKKAIEYHKQHLNIAKEVGERKGERMAYGNLGFAYYRLGDFKQAVECHKQDLSITKDLGDRAREVRAYHNLGIAYTSLSNFKEATECHSQQLSIAKEVGDRDEEGHAYSNLGNAYNSLGSFKQAIEYHKQALRIFKDLGDRAGEGGTYGNLGNAYHSLGDFKQAIEYYKRCRGIAKEVAGRDNEGTAYGNLGNAYLAVGIPKKALEYYQKGLTIAKQVGDRLGKGGAYNNMGIAYYFLRNLQENIESNKKALSIGKEIGNRLMEGAAYGNLGKAYHRLGDFGKAAEFHKQHLSIAKEIGDRMGEGTAYGDLGRACHSLGDYKQAMEHHKQHLIIAKEIGDRVGEGTACYNLGLDYESKASFSEALDYYRSSIRIFDCTRALLQTEDAWKIGFHDMYREEYTALWRILLKTGKTDEALCAAEQGRAQALMDVLKRHYGVDTLPSTSVEPKEMIAAMLNNSTIQTVFIAVDESINTISFWMLRKDREVLFIQKEIEHGDASILLDATLQEIGAGVRIKCENRSMDELTDDLPSNRDDVGEKDKSCTSSVNSLRPLYDAIIGPIADLLQGDQLIVVPDGPFCLAPYSALSEPIRIRVVPSLTTLQLIAGAPDDFHSKSGALLVGDPCLEKVPMHLSQLLYAKKEVEMIGKLLKTTPLTGKDATKDEVLKRLKSVALVHIAAHGCAQSGEIVLALNLDCISQPPKRQDYILTMSDVQSVCLRARLVVLSCCHSGRGEVKSEGVVGIARSFLCAGARSVLVSLWAIDDEATMVFMESFYQHLSHGKSASEALHQAMKSLRESEEFSAVKYWAPFVLIGDDVTIDFGDQK